MKKRRPLVSAVIPVLNGMKYLPDFLKSYSKTDYFPRETIFIDDGSDDGTPEYIKKFYLKLKTSDKLIIIKTKRRMGIAGSRNVGIRRSTGKYVAFVEVDMAFRSSWLSELVDICEKDGSIGGVNAKVLDFDDRKTIMAAGIRLMPQTGWVIPIGLGEMDRGQYDKIDTSLISGVGALVPKRVLKKIKGFDEVLNRNVEDIDLGWRIAVAGYKTLYDPRAVVYHHIAKNPKIRRDVSSFSQQFNLSKNIRLIFKNYTTKNVIHFFPIAIASNLARVVSRFLDADLLGAFGILYSFVWFAVLLPDTIRARNVISRYRLASDESVINNIMYKGNFISLYNNYLKKTRSTSIKLSLKKG